ncbi:hypothetical protein BB560_005419, partial [Smittium megazygosporum]
LGQPQNNFANSQFNQQPQYNDRNLSNYDNVQYSTQDNGNTRYLPAQNSNHPDNYNGNNSYYDPGSNRTQNQQFTQYQAHPSNQSSHPPYVDNNARFNDLSVYPNMQARGEPQNYQQTSQAQARGSYGGPQYQGSYQNQYVPPHQYQQQNKHQEYNSGPSSTYPNSSTKTQRNLHEELERIEQAYAELNLLKLSTHKHKLGREHKLKELKTAISKYSGILLEMYEDKSGLRAKEIKKTGENRGINEFYNQLAEINIYYRRNPGTISGSLELQYSTYSKAPETKEEYELRMKKLKKRLRQDKVYDSSGLTFGHSKLEKDILEKKAEVSKRKSGENTEDVEDLDEPEYFMNAADEAKLDSMFSGEESMGFIERYSPLTTPVEIQNAYNNYTMNQPEADKKPKENGETAKKSIEGKIYCEAYTIANVERKQSLTEQERNQEAEINDEEIDLSEEEESEHIYNPLKLPLGWDGKPIPYWLYKLHGLRVEYTCEICGNYIYRGRKAYDLHFQEARHSNNMRKLGIPNTKQFHDISRIEDAVSLWEKIKNQKNSEISVLDTFEEFEDTEGNVFNRKTYEDLKRQGLL